MAKLTGRSPWGWAGLTAAGPTLPCLAWAGRAWAVALVLGIAGSPVVQGRSVTRLTVGQTQVIRVTGTITKVRVLNPAVADVADHTSRTVTIVGVDGGATEFLITTARGVRKIPVVVTRIEVGRLYKQVRNFMGPIEGIRPRVIGDTIVIYGAALTPEDYGKAQRSVELFGSKVLNLVRFKPSAVQQVNQILRKSGLTDVRARLVGGAVVGTLFLEGSVGSEAEMEKVKAILRAYGLVAENLIKVGGGKQILVDVYFVEMRSRGLQDIGVKWPARVGIGSAAAPLGVFSAKMPLSPAAAPTITADFQAPILPTQAALNLLIENGKGRLLAQPRLVCGSGKQAEFLVGGEVAIPMVTNDTFNVEYKPYGVTLKVTPTTDSLGNVQTKILAEVSEPDLSTSVNIQGNSIPGFRTRRFNTFVTVKEGASIVLSGLFTNSDQKAVSKVPLLGHIPILGELFKSRNFQQQKTTLVVFVTPRVVSSRHPWVIRTIRDIQKLYEEYEDEVGWQIFD